MVASRIEELAKLALSVTRRHTIALLGAVSALALFPRLARAEANLAARIIILADLHSAYERLGPLLAAIQREVAGSAVPHLILINGDIFEAANVVTARSNGAIDWAFLAALRELAPVILNLGNHEPDLENDLANFVAAAEKAGITVVSNITDTRTGRLYADPSVSVSLGAITATVVGIATNALPTYPKATREMVDIPDPVVWARENLGTLIGQGTLPIILSHSGVVADRGIMASVPDGALLVGGHDHLLFTFEDGATRYVHTSSWANVYTVVDVAADRSLTVRQNRVDPTAASPEGFGALVASTLATHLTVEDTTAVGTSTTMMTLGQTGRSIAATMAAAVDADAGFIGHTTLGTGIPSGPVSRYQYDAIVRFDGKFMVVADVDAAVFQSIMARCNQDGDIGLDQRTGDFLYSAPTVAPGKATLRIVTNDWSAMNQMKYFGRDDLAFAEVPDLRLKAVVAESLR
jgi:2',3'-cyclic-nucleotide 2'-phosphodiesterase (5'-nucleotidase family)